MRLREGVGGVRIREGERVWGGATSLRQGQSDKRAIERMRAREGETGGAGGGLLAAGEADAAGGGVEGGEEQVVGVGLLRPAQPVQQRRLACIYIYIYIYI